MRVALVVWVMLFSINTLLYSYKIEQGQRLHAN
jgi:hypothetical protein